MIEFDKTKYVSLEDELRNKFITTLETTDFDTISSFDRGCLFGRLSEYFNLGVFDEFEYNHFLNTYINKD